MGVGADLFSAWTNSPDGMATAISIDAKSIVEVFLGKPRWAFIIGNYLGVFFIPLHMFGFYLVYLALKPAGEFKARLVLMASFYLVAIGAGFHGTLAFIGDVVQSGDSELLMSMIPYWQNWGGVMIAGYLIVSGFLLILIVSGRTLYARKMALLSPLSLVVITTSVIVLLPESSYGVRNFLAVTGFNLPLLVFYAATLITLLDRKSKAQMLT